MKNNMNENMVMLVTGGEQTESLPGGGFHGGEQTEALPGEAPPPERCEK